MKTLLVPVDFSDDKGLLLAEAEAEARRRGATLHLLHIIEPAAEVAGFETDPEMMRLQLGQDLETEERIERTRVKELVEAVKARGLEACGDVKFGLPADEILDAAKAEKAELIVMGSHGHGALYHLFTGSVVTGVLKRTEVPVLVVPLRERKS
jgi:nucleotide-binding universal stress UspA family protein